MKRIRLVAAKLLRKENVDPVDLAESLLAYTNKRSLCLGRLLGTYKCGKRREQFLQIFN